MEKRSARKFIVISNIVVSVLCAASVLAFFIMPLWRVDFSLTFTPKLAEAVKSAADSSVKSPAGYRRTGAQVNDVSGELFESVLDRLGSDGTKIEFSQTLTCAEAVSFIGDSSPEHAERLIESSADQLVDEVSQIASEVMDVTVKVIADETIRSQIDKVLTSNGAGTIRDLEKEVPDLDRRIEAIIERILGAINEENATVQSATDVILESADEVVQILAASEKFADLASEYSHSDKEEMRDAVSSVLNRFADGDGKLILKEKIEETLTEYLNELIEGMDLQLSENRSGKRPAAAPLSLTTGPSGPKDGLKDTVRNGLGALMSSAAGEAVLKMYAGIVAVAGALMVIFIFMMMYPTIRTVTNIGKEDPGFGFAVPIIGGLLPFLFLVILPSMGPLLIKALSGAGKMMRVPPVITSVLDSTSVTYSSGTVVAFAVAVGLIVFAFIYQRKRKVLK